MASGTGDPGTGVPQQQQPYQPQMQQQMYPQQYVQQKPPTDIADMLKKRILIILILVGALIILVARVVNLYSTDIDVDRAGNLLAMLGGFMIAASAVVWALGSKRTTDWQNVGLLILAALLIMAYG